MSLTPYNLNRIIHLFEKLQDLSISKDEYDELKKWTLLAEENQQIWDNFHNEEKVVKDRAELKSFDSELALSKIKSTVKRKQFFRYITAAATLVIIFSFSLYFITTRNTITKKTVLVANNDILPGGNHAVLKFSDNQTIVLDNKKNGIKVDNNSIAYQNGDLVTQNTTNTITRSVTLSVPRGSKYEITLDDGTRIWTNAATELTFPETFKNGKTREVELQGEAYFEVAHNAKKPFIVKMGDQSVEVLGTSFNLSSYQSDEDIKSTLFTGKIALTLNQTLNTAKSILLPGQQAIYNKQQRKLEILNVDGKKEIAWKNGDFLFENDHILAIMKQLERWYDIRVIYQGDFKQSYFSGIVSRSQPLSAVLEMLATTDKLKFKINKSRKEVVLTKN